MRKRSRRICMQIGTTSRNPKRNRVQQADNTEDDMTSDIAFWQLIGLTSEDRTRVHQALSNLIHLPVSERRKAQFIPKIMARLQNWTVDQQYQAAV